MIAISSFIFIKSDQYFRVVGALDQIDMSLYVSILNTNYITLGENSITSLSLNFLISNREIVLPNR